MKVGVVIIILFVTIFTFIIIAFISNTLTIVISSLFITISPVTNP